MCGDACQSPTPPSWLIDLSQCFLYPQQDISPSTGEKWDAAKVDGAPSVL